MTVTLHALLSLLIILGFFVDVLTKYLNFFAFSSSYCLDCTLAASRGNFIRVNVQAQFV
jgi:hypothetical protein